MMRCLDEANRIEAVSIEVETIKKKLQRRVNCAETVLRVNSAYQEMERETDW